ncbi:ABC transporter permease [Kitasatospora sp. NPDC050543]|uniref:ABC transporter permease n=1 Tax=Kitasatospora sp. NPDC050543 TaxID=3364054 RepID=UPI00379982A9
MSAAQPVTADRPGAAAGSGAPLQARLGWLMWRQHRMLIRVLLVAVAVAVVAVPVVHSAMVSYIDSHHIAGCREYTRDPACPGRAMHNFQETYGRLLQLGGALLTLMPLVLGVFVGAPLLAAEFERGTWRLVLTQSVTRTRWVAAKLLTVGAIGLAVSAVAMVMYRWLWLAGGGELTGVRWFSKSFMAAGGPVLVATTLLGLALGAAAGLLLRRVVRAMAATACVLLVLQYLLGAVRPYLIHWDTARGGPSAVGYDTWGFARQFLGSVAHQLPYDLCSVAPDYSGCLLTHGGNEEFNIHRASDYWPLQAAESGICLALTAALVLLVLRRVRCAPL